LLEDPFHVAVVVAAPATVAMTATSAKDNKHENLCISFTLHKKEDNRLARLVREDTSSQKSQLHLQTRPRLKMAKSTSHR
jgi:hypothetical protein